MSNFFAAARDDAYPHLHFKNRKVGGGGEAFHAGGLSICRYVCIFLAPRKGRTCVSFQRGLNRLIGLPEGARCAPARNRGNAGTVEAYIALRALRIKRTRRERKINA